ncbi:hypothetical protein ABIE41_000609 [Bosea sp. OAE506]|uniref:WbqC family protein n=1 Tax=Bosea sp. OAE506 TaxID=2663870 RepID=UPI00178BB927
MFKNTSKKTIAILQSNYIPWKGYFDIVSAVDEFLIFDDVQFTKRDWRNRNLIVQDGKLLWLTIPVNTKGAFHASIADVTIAEPNWARKHWMSIVHAYRKAPYYGEIGPQLETLYSEAGKFERLTDVNLHFIRGLTTMIGLSTTFLRTDIVPRQAADPTGRLVEICVARQASLYLSGPAAKSYIEQPQFDAAHVDVVYANYAGYPVYDQAMEPFEQGVSIIDTLMRCGPASTFAQLKSNPVPSGLFE